jgi:hypothetical protein
VAHDGKLFQGIYRSAQEKKIAARREVRPALVAVSATKEFTCAECGQTDDGLLIMDNKGRSAWRARTWKPQRPGRVMMPAVPFQAVKGSSINPR